MRIIDVEGLIQLETNSKDKWPSGRAFVINSFIIHKSMCQSIKMLGENEDRPTPRPEMVSPWHGTSSLSIQAVAQIELAQFLSCYWPCRGRLGLYSDLFSYSQHILGQPEDNFWEPILSFQSLGPWDWTKVIQDSVLFGIHMFHFVNINYL